MVDLPGCWAALLPITGPAGLDSPLRYSVRSASSSRGWKRPSDVDDVQEWKRDRRDPGHDCTFSPTSVSGLAGPSQPRDVNTPGPSLEDRVSQLSAFVADLLVKLDRRFPVRAP